MLSYDEIIKIVLESDISDWGRGYPKLHQDPEIFYKPNPVIRFKDLGTVVEDFKEKWANSFPDPKAFSSEYGLFYFGECLANFVLVFVDGCRCALPLPYSRMNEQRTEVIYGPVKMLDYKVARILHGDSLVSFDEYMERGGLCLPE